MNVLRLNLLLWRCWLATCVILRAVCASNEESDIENGEFINEWAVRIPGGERHAELVAREHGYHIIRRAVSFGDVYLMEKSDFKSRSKREAVHHTNKLREDFRVDWAEQQVAKRRDKRDLHKRDRLKQMLTKVDIEAASKFNDHQWPNQWYLQRSHVCDDSVIHLNTAGAWAMGYTGKGVTVCILDDGLEWNHTDIIRNYDPLASWDVNDNDSDPSPRYDLFGTNRHGSRCAGEVAMMANNEKCGVGVAYDVKIGGVRLLDGTVTDSREAEALGYNCEHTDIYSASWGPTDDGETLDGPGRLAQSVIESCISRGRKGKGVIYVWAGGNGGVKGDNCGCDGYINSIYTITINSISESGTMPYYGEKCSAIMACTNSGGSYNDHQISTIDLHDKCTDSHSGTSAAAPLAAGVIALVLQANSNLTWRDVQHILVCSAETYQIWDNPGWGLNGANIYYNDRFGFGVMNAHSMTHAAVGWKNVGPQNNCTANSEAIKLIRLISGHEIHIDFDASNCVGNGSDKVNYLEHVQLKISANYSRRGALKMDLISPLETRSTLLYPRVADKSVRGLKEWNFMSLRFWGENPSGKWTLIVLDETGEFNKGVIIKSELLLRGTSDMPPYRQNGVTCGLSKQSEEANLPCQPKEFEDALEYQVNEKYKEGQMTLKKSLKDANCALHLYLNNYFQESENLLKLWSDRSLYHALSLAVHHFVQALMTSDPRDVNLAMSDVNSALGICSSRRKKKTLLVDNSVTKLIKRTNYDSYSEEEAHAELCYCELLMLKAALVFIHDDSIISYIKAGLHIHAAFLAFKECQDLLEHRQWTDEDSKLHFETGVLFISGASNLVIFCFSAISGPADIKVCRYFMQFGGGNADIEYCKSLIEPELKTHPKGAIYLFFFGRFEVLNGNFDEAIDWLLQSTSSQDRWRQLKNLCHWDLTFCHIFKGAHREAFNFFSILSDESHWAKAATQYMCAVILMACQDFNSQDQDNVNKIMTRVPSLRCKLSGKSIPIEKFFCCRAQRYIEQGRLFLPTEEMVYTFNYFPMISKNLEVLQKMFDNIDTSVTDLKVNVDDKGSFYLEDYCLGTFLKGVCLRHMNKPLLAEQCFTEVIKQENCLKQDVHLSVWSLIEMGYMHNNMTNYKEAINCFELAK
ncbi:Neuroendocrine convertase 1 [Chamberlinius hualienensis]